MAPGSSGHNPSIIDMGGGGYREKYRADKRIKSGKMNHPRSRRLSKKKKLALSIHADVANMECMLDQVQIHLILHLEKWNIAGSQNVSRRQHRARDSRIELLPFLSLLLHISWY
jgi:predicted SAM-dependent methyltransferase